MKILDLGFVSYFDALKKMDTLHTEVVHTPLHKGYLLVVEHPPTVTMGYRNNTQDLLLTPEGLEAKGINYFKIDRGGSVTVHESGQCVLYPIFNIFEYKKSVRSYVYILEEAMIETCKFYGVHAHRDLQNPGIWVEDNKIGAVGIRISSKTTKHGIAFNVNNNLKTFSYVIPCGLFNKGVTTLEREIFKIKLDHNVLSFDHVKQKLIDNFLKLINF